MKRSVLLMGPVPAVETDAGGNGGGAGTDTKAPANMSVAQLGAMLSKSSTPDKQAKAGAAHAAAAGKSGTTPREKASAQNEPEPDKRQTDHSQTVSEPGEGEEENESNEGEGEGGEGESTAENAENAEGEGETAEGEATEGEEGAGDATGETKPELPAELAAAIAEAKAGGQKGLASVLKRVHTLVDQRDTERMGRLNAERELQAAQAEAEEARKGQGSTESRPTGASNDPIEGHQAVTAIRGKLTNVEAYLDWTDANPEGGTLPDGKGGEVEFSAAQVRQMRRTAERQRTELVSELTQTKAAVKHAFNEVQAQTHAVAVKLYPWLEKKDSPSYVRMQQMLQALPGLKALPDHELIVARYERGRLAEEAAAKAAKLAPKTTKAPAKVVTTAGTVTAARRKAGAEDGDEVKQTQKQFEESGRSGDLAKQFAARRRAQVARR